ncbi:MAG: acyltransferase [Nitrospira sp.]|nr:acyltransferase [Nitrospira sp.]
MRGNSKDQHAFLLEVFLQRRTAKYVMRKTELTGLTGIRFYASAVVFMTHAVEKIPGGNTLDYSRVFLESGAIAVSFFFVLSGFILTYNYESRFRERVTFSSYVRFVWDRLARIYPVHLLMLVIVLPIAMFSPNHPLDWSALPFHLTLLQCWWPSASPRFFSYLNTPSWSISCEWFFYIIAPFAMFFVLGQGRRWVLWVLILVYACGLAWLLIASESDSARNHLVNWFAPSRLVEFLAGVYLARVFLVSQNLITFPYSLGMQALGIVLIIAGAIGKQYPPWLFHGGLLIVPGASLLILGLAYGHGYFVTHLSQDWVNRLGLASFSFYMVHDPMLRALRGIFFYLDLSVDSWGVLVVLAFAVFLLAQVGALLMYRYYETALQTRLRAARTLSG